MKQLLQNLKSGRTELVDVPCPRAAPGQLLIRSRRSLVSAGTERMLLDFAKANWLEKARQHPEKLRSAIEKIRTDGLMPTVEAIGRKLDEPLPMGYCNVGKVTEVGPGVSGFQVGDRVVSNGHHAEVVAVPTKLCARIPPGVDDESAAFCIVGAIALQAVRLAHPTIGESVAVTGLGLVGLLTVQILRANGCRVLGIDFDRNRLDLARTLGAEVVDLGADEDPVAAGQRFSRGMGMDAVIITASTKSSEPVHQGALMSRKRGRIVLAGVAGLQLLRDDFYQKELTFQVSCSYGPGRYDPLYEERGVDYPVGFVRWTEQRNLEAVLDLMDCGKLVVTPLITHRFLLSDALKAYDLLASNAPSIGILLEYAGEQEGTLTSSIVVHSGRPAKDPSVGFVGAGNYAKSFLIPAFLASGVGLHTIVSSGGLGSAMAARKFDFQRAGTEAAMVVSGDDIDIVVIATRHDSHADLAIQAIEGGKHVFVEKPLCLTFEELKKIESAYRGASSLLMVGFNRRFSPHIVRMKELLSAVPGPKACLITVNAGALPISHWTLDPMVGGGRVLGENCHFIDLLRYLVGAPVSDHATRPMSSTSRDSVTMTLNFVDGSIGTILYLANGSRAFPKERVEVFASGRVLQLDNFRTLRGWGWPRFRRMRLWRQDKGQRACVAAFVEAVRAGTASPIPFDEILEVSRISIESAQAAG